MEAALDGSGPVPWSWFISQLCESFSCTPLQILRELGYQLEATPWPLLEEILLFRSYVNSRQAVVHAEEQSETITGDSADLVRLIRSRVQRARLGLPIFDQSEANHAL